MRRRKLLLGSAFSTAGECALVAPPRFRSRKDNRQSIRFTANARFRVFGNGRLRLRTAAEPSSHRTLNRLHTSQRQVRPLRSASPHLAELDERITVFRVRPTSTATWIF